MPDVHLIGGGRDPEGLRATHTPFVAACHGGPIVCLVVDDGAGVDVDRWHDALTGAGAEPDAVTIHVLSAQRPPREGDVTGAAGVYIAGGLTPLYAELFAGWAPPHGAVYAGYSAGAAIAAARAVVGGWRTVAGAAVCPQEAAEDLDAVTIVDGLGLVPFAVDVHAAQWGTLGRLVHAVGEGLVAEGWALDEGALLVDGDVYGPGAAWHVTGDGRVRRVPGR